MNSVLVKIISGVLAVFILVYVGFQAYSYFYSPYKTETVTEVEVADSVESEGIAFRDEILIKARKTNGGVISYFYQNGAKVARNSVVGVIYESEEYLEKNYQIQRLSEEIVVLKECTVPSTGTALNDMLSKQLSEEQLSLIENIDSHNLSGVNENKNVILKTLNKIQLLTGKLKSLNKRIQKLKNKRAKLQSELSNRNKEITAAASGFFVDTTDGFEQENGYSRANSQTVESLRKLLKQKVKPADDAIGKIITSNDWRFLITVSKEESVKFTQGQKISASFSSFADEDVELYVEKIGNPDVSGNVVITLKSDLMDENIATLRNDKVKINFTNNRGLKVTKKALYIKDGVKGVYCLLDDEVIFKKVDIVFETDDFFLSKQHPEDSSYLKIYDDVIVKGKDLYDKHTDGE